MSTGLIIAMAAAALCLLLLIELLSRLSKRLIVGVKDDLEGQAQRSLEQLFLFVPVRQLLPIWGSLTVLVVLGFGWLVGVEAMLVVALVCVMLPRWWYRRAHHRRRERIDQQLVDVLLALSASLSAGLGFVAALEQVSQATARPISDELRLLVRQIKFGRAVPESLALLSERVPTQAVRFTVQILQLGFSQGGQQAVFLKSLATNLQAQRQMESKLLSLTAQARMQGRIMAMLPVGLFVLLSIVEPANTEILFATDTGKIMLLVGGVLIFLGHRLSRLILLGSEK